MAEEKKNTPSSMSSDSRGEHQKMLKKKKMKLAEAKRNSHTTHCSSVCVKEKREREVDGGNFNMKENWKKKIDEIF